MKYLLQIVLCSTAVFASFLFNVSKSVNISDLKIHRDEYDTKERKTDEGDLVALHKISLFFLKKTNEQEVTHREIARIKICIHKIKDSVELRNYYSDQPKLLQILEQKKVNLVVYLKELEISDDSFKFQGLGKQLFSYALMEMKQKFPQSIYYWWADPEYFEGIRLSKENLFRFYKNCGATFLDGTYNTFYIDLATLDLGFFKSKKTIKSKL